MKRRDVLKKTGTGIAIGVGFTSVASASSASEAREHVAAQDDLLGELAASGVLESADPDEFEFETRARPSEATDGVMATTVTRDGSETGALIASREVESGTLEVFVLPETDESFAVVRDGEEIRNTFGSVSTNSDCSVDCWYCYSGFCYWLDYNTCICNCYCTCQVCPRP